MILYRYLLKDIFSHTTAVSLVFLFIVLSSRSIQYLEQVSRGELSAELVFWVIILRLPEFLQLIIPLGFFLSIVLVMGRLYAESEMTILEQNGYSKLRFLKVFMFSGTSLALVTGTLSLWVTPIFNEKLDKVYLNTSFEDNFYSIQAGRFNSLENLSVIYAKEKEQKILKNIFLKIQDFKEFSSNNFITAKRAYIPEGQKNVLVLEEGFSFSEDKSNQVEMSFDTLLINFRDKNNLTRKKMVTQDKSSKADMQWRFSIPLLCIVSAFLAFPLSKVRPRQDRFTRVLPSILVFISYLGLLLLVKGWIEEDFWPSFPGLLIIHALFLVFGLSLLVRQSKFGGSS